MKTRTRPTTPYSHQLGDRDPIQTQRDTVSRIQSITAAWKDSDYERTYSPGKWTARQILIHLAQSELALGSRARLALSTPNYVAQPFDQDTWLARDSGLNGPEAANAFITIARMNSSFYAGLSDMDRDTPLHHPEYGALTVDWILHQTAGHQIHHLKQLEALNAD